MTQTSKLIAEAIGTFALCFIGAGAICTATQLGLGGPGLLGIAIAHGIILSIAVSATMNISGGHLNPAVTITMMLTKRIGLPDAIAYIIAQCAGAALAGLLVLVIFDGRVTADGKSVIQACGLGTPYFLPAITPFKAILIEAILTFLLVFSIFGTAVDPRAPKLGGFGIGLTICADILLGGPLTGAAMNPARTFGPGLVAALSGNLPQFWSQHFVYWIGPVAGAAIAGLLYDNLIMQKK